MQLPPVFDIDPVAFAADPYPDLETMRAEAPIAHVPQLGATLFTRHADISVNEKRIDVFSSYQPDGLMSVLMGENMMRKDGPDHALERKASFPAMSPRTVRDHWLQEFHTAADAVLDRVVPLGVCDLVRDVALPICGEALRTITGVKALSAAEIDATSQAMIDGIANYADLPEVTARCRAATAKIDAAIDDTTHAHPLSLVAAQRDAQLPDTSVKANIKLAISGGQNEPRDAIAGTVWALLRHPDQLALIQRGQATWRDAFEEYARWISPIGMSPRRVARAETLQGLRLEPETRAFFMFGSGNRDAAVFEDPDRFDLTRNTGKSLAFGAGPHFCAGAPASRALISEVALPKIFARLPGLRLASEVAFTGWAFRGPLAVSVAWDPV